MNNKSLCITGNVDEDVLQRWVEDKIGIEVIMVRDVDLDGMSDYMQRLHLDLSLDDIYPQFVPRIFINCGSVSGIYSKHITWEQIMWKPPIGGEFTGNKDIDLMIMNLLKIRDLLELKSCNKYLRNLFNSTPIGNEIYRNFYSFEKLNDRENSNFVTRAFAISSIELIKILEWENINDNFIDVTIICCERWYADKLKYLARYYTLLDVLDANDKYFDKHHDMILKQKYDNLLTDIFL